MNSRDITILKSDFDKLDRLVQCVNTKTAELLEDELNRAHIIEDLNQADSLNFVSMNSIVDFKDVESGLTSTIQLVYPNDAGTADSLKKISVLAPVGAALIGLHVGQKISWPLPSGKNRILKVVSVKTPDNKNKAA